MKKFITLEEAKHIRLSTNFTLDEFIKSDIAIRLNIDNSLPLEYLKNIKYLVDTVLQPLRNIIGPIRITSGYRSKALCIAINSNPSSNHTIGCAVDIEPLASKISLLMVLNVIEFKFSYKELIAEFFPNGWVHVAVQEGANLHKLKLKDKKHNYSLTTIKYIKDIYGRHSYNRKVV